MVEKINRSLNLEIKEVKFGLSILGFENLVWKLLQLAFFESLVRLERGKEPYPFSALDQMGRNTSMNFSEGELNKFEEKNYSF